MQVAYVPQSAFIFNASVKDNILFGLPHDPARYEHAIKASALDTDLRNMPGETLARRGHTLPSPLDALAASILRACFVEPSGLVPCSMLGDASCMAGFLLKILGSAVSLWSVCSSNAVW